MGILFIEVRIAVINKLFSCNIICLPYRIHERPTAALPVIDYKVMPTAVSSYHTLVVYQCSHQFGMMNIFL